MSSGNTYNWEMTGAPEGPVSPEAAQSWNEFVQSGNAGSNAQQITPPTYDEQVAMAQSWGVPQDQIESIVGTPESVYANNRQQALSQNDLYGFTPTWAGDYGLKANSWEMAPDFTKQTPTGISGWQDYGYERPFSVEDIQKPVDPNSIRYGFNNTPYAAVNSSIPGLPSGGEYIVDPSSGRFVLDASGNPIPVPQKPNNPNDMGDVMGNYVIPYGIALMAAMTGAGAAGLIGQGAAAAGAGAGAGAAEGTGAATASALGGTQATGAGGTTLNSLLAGAGKGALTGSAMGGISSAMQGGNIGQGILRGGLTGAVGGGIGSGLSGTLGSTAANILGGTGAGAAGAALSGGNVGRGALMGGASGALNTGLNQVPGLQSTPGQFGLGDIARGAISGGALSSAMGGTFGKGAIGGIGGAYLSNAVSPYINNAYNTYFNGGVQPTAVNPATGLPWSATGSGYAGDAGYTPPTPTTLSQGQTPADMQASLAVQSPYVKTSADLGDLGLGNVEVAPPTGQSFVPGDTVVSKVNPDSSVTLNEDGSLTAKTSMGEQVIPKESANQALAYVLNQNAKYDAVNQPIDYSQGDVYIGSGMSSPIQTDIRDVMPGQEPTTGMFPRMELPQGAQGAYANEPYMQQVQLKPTEQSFAGTRWYNPAYPGINKDDTSTWPLIEAPTSEGGLSTAPFKEQGVQDVNATSEKQTLDALNSDREKGDITDSEYKQEVEKLAKDVVDKGLVSEKEAKDLTDAEVVKLGDAREQAGFGKTGIGPGAGTEGTGPGRGNEAGPEGALGREATDSENIAAMAAAAAEAGPGENGTGEGEGNGEGGDGGGSGGGGGGGGTGGTGTGKGISLGKGTSTPYKLPTTAAGKGNTINLPGITNLTPGMTAGDTSYELAGRAHFALGGSTNSSSASMGSSPLDKYLARLTPGLTEGMTDYQLPGYYADGGEVKEHNPQFFSEGGLGSIENRYVKGDGDGTSDSIPAMLANGEFVIPADVVSSLGNGSNDSGAHLLDEFLSTIRKHKRAADEKQLPPDSKGALGYLLEAKKKVKK